MIKKCCLAILCLAPLMSYSTSYEIQSDKIETILLQEITEKKLLDQTYRYLDFISKIGGGEIFSYTEVAADLLTLDCQKVFNGNLYTASRDLFIADLLSVNETQGCWTILPLDILISPKNKTSTLRLIIKMGKSDVFTAMVLLRYDDNYLIKEINEVFNKVGTSYDFEDESK